MYPIASAPVPKIPPATTPPVREPVRKHPTMPGHPPHGGGGHGGHHAPGKVFPGQPPAYILPPATGPGVTQPKDVPDTAKGSPLPHWDGDLLGSSLHKTADGVAMQNLYVNGAFNYLDGVEGVDAALAATQKLTAGPDRPAAVLWRDKFNIVHAQALLTYGGTSLGANGAQPLQQAAPVAAHLTREGLLGVNLGHPEAIAIVDGDLVFKTAVNDVVPIPKNGAPGFVAPA